MVKSLINNSLKDIAVLRKEFRPVKDTHLPKRLFEAGCGGNAGSE